MNNKLLTFFLLGLGLTILSAAIIIRSSQTTEITAAKNGYPAPDELLQPALSRCDQQKALNDSSTSNSKPIMSEEEYQQCIAALTAAPKTKVLKPIETPLPTSADNETRLRRIAGNGILIEGLLGMYDSHSFVQTNAWYENNGNRFIYIYAGVKKDASPDRTRSAVAILVSDLAGNWLAEGGIYEAASPVGELTIIDAKGDLLILTSPDGNLLYFDVSSREYITPDSNTIMSSVKRDTVSGVIVEKPDSPYGDSYVISNHWFQEVNGKRISVFAGQPVERNGKAVILVTDSKGEPTASDKPEVYFIPGYITYNTNYPRIFAVDLDKVILVGARGGEFVFDLSKKRFLSLTEIAHLPDDPALLALEAYFQKIREDASSPGRILRPTIFPVPAYP
jgi:hypothetical protein